MHVLSLIYILFKKILNIKDNPIERLSNVLSKVSTGNLLIFDGSILHNIVGYQLQSRGNSAQTADLNKISQKTEKSHE